MGPSDDLCEEPERLESVLFLGLMTGYHEQTNKPRRPTIASRTDLQKVLIFVPSSSIATLAL